MTGSQSDLAGEDSGGQDPVSVERSLFSMALWGPDGPPDDIYNPKGLRSCGEEDGHDDDCWGHISTIRQPVAIPPPSMLLSQQDMQAIATGYAPMDMNDKWLAFMEGNRLFIHRSWTGHGIYEVTFAAKQTGFVATSAKIESDPARQRGDFDPDDFDPVWERDQLQDLIVHVSGDPMPLLLPTILARRPQLEAVLGDITDQDVDAIVNTANAGLVGGEGVNGAIHRAAGPELLGHCRSLGGCPVGRAVVTPGFRLQAPWIVHTVGPAWWGGTHGEPVLLESCYRESLARADEVGAESVAFPAVATGKHGYPLEEAAATAVDAVRSTSTKVRTIRWVCSDRQTLSAFQSAIGEDT
jgi:O-acetyl-ADP-ribose deacetylase (regulator of RNase III)